MAAKDYDPRVPHLRPPSIDHGIVSLLWAVGFGLFIWFGSLAVGVSSATAFIMGAVCGFLIFLFVRIRGEERPRQVPRRSRPPR
jgi:hypothetical protein